MGRLWLLRSQSLFDCGDDSFDDTLEYLFVLEDSVRDVECRESFIVGVVVTLKIPDDLIRMRQVMQAVYLDIESGVFDTEIDRLVSIGMFKFGIDAVFAERIM